MIQVKNKLYLLIICLGLCFFMNINHVMAAPKKNDKGKEISSSEKKESKITKKDISKYYELVHILEDYSEEDRSQFIEILSDPQKLKSLQEKASQEKALKEQKTGSSSKKPNDSKK
ncbi:hypothetical protein OC683_02275 ['Crotalaria aegyptiaca' phytoplasma]|uniref:SAP11 effector protein n=1 Tax=Candidatus Phytoplasma crotalariae TaxID=2982627 RepID=A0ABT9D6T3_9MOLU|nr:hypothetical protein ['Crotalaria aegyptiaca' phytoplasma]MDO8059419.1 hypothetical protein ['Crotalaria aegyptiaca' phytoplasma]